MTYTRRLIIVVAAPDHVAANTQAQQVDKAGGVRTFNVGLTPAGSPPGTPPTHYWCSWAMQPAEADNLRSRIALLVAAGQVHIFDGNAVSPEEVLTALGLQRPQTVRL